LGEARRLMGLVLAYYTRPECYSHVHAMNHSPDTFLFDQMAQQALALETVATKTPHFFGIYKEMFGGSDDCDGKYYSSSIPWGENCITWVRNTP